MAFEVSVETAKKLPPPMNSAWRTIKTGDLGGICGGKTFIELKLLQVRPDKFERFEVFIREVSANQLKCEGCNRSSISRGSSPSTESNSVSRREN